MEEILGDPSLNILRVSRPLPQWAAAQLLPPRAVGGLHPLAASWSWTAASAHLHRECLFSDDEGTGLECGLLCGLWSWWGCAGMDFEALDGRALLPWPSLLHGPGRGSSCTVSHASRRACRASVSAASSTTTAMWSEL